MLIQQPFWSYLARTCKHHPYCRPGSRTHTSALGGMNGQRENVSTHLEMCPSLSSVVGKEHNSNMESLKPAGLIPWQQTTVQVYKVIWLHVLCNNPAIQCNCRYLVKRVQLDLSNWEQHYDLFKCLLATNVNHKSPAQPLPNLLFLSSWAGLWLTQTAVSKKNTQK